MMKGIVACLIVLFSASALAANPQEIREKQQELKNISNQISQVQTSLNSKLTEQNTLQEQLQQSEVRLGQLALQIKQLNQQTQAAQKELDKTLATQEQYSKQLTVQQEALGQQVRLLYQMGTKPTIKTILKGEQLSSLNRRLNYFHYLNASHVETAKNIKNTLSILSNNLSLLHEQEQNYQQLAKQKQDQQQKEVLAQKQRQQVITQIKQQMISKQQQLEDLAAYQQALQQTLVRLLDRFSDPVFKSFKSLQGKLSWPIKGSVSPATMLGNSERSTGVLIRAPHGAGVHPISNGKVIFANWLRGYGLLIIINHGDGYMSLYARNHSLFAKAGDIVTPKDTIASLGNSGGYENPRLYFEIRRNGTPVDPRIWCS